MLPPAARGVTPRPLGMMRDMQTRRAFLRTALCAGSAARVGPIPLEAGRGQQARPLRILILGGTGFIGPHQVRYAVARGHRVTLFNRGRSGAGLFAGLAGVEQRLGDRASTPGDYDALRRGEWDVVIDNPATRPRWVREAAAALRGRVGQYVLISSMSAYASHATPGADESAPLATTTTPDREVGNDAPPLYGPMKALCEAEAQQAFPHAATIIRPSLVVGVGDPTDRFTYWPVRIARGGDVLAPPAADPVQLIDARDLSEWVIRCAEERTVGVFNAGGDGSRFTVGQMLESTRAALGAEARFVHVPAAFLGEHNVAPWIDLPAWLPAVGMFAGSQLRSVDRARAAGLTLRPFVDTVTATMTFYRAQSADRRAALRAGLSADREAAVLVAWKARAQAE